MLVQVLFGETHLVAHHDEHEGISLTCHPQPMILSQTNKDRFHVIPDGHPDRVTCFICRERAGLVEVPEKS